MSSIFDALPAIFVQHLGDDDVVYTPAGGAPLAIRAIFFDTPLQVESGEYGAPVDNQNKELHLSAADVPSPREGDSATVRGVTYRVMPPIRRDGQGMIAVALVQTS